MASKHRASIKRIRTRVTRRHTFDQNWQTHMKPSPLPSNPTLLDRLEYALQWSLCPFIIEPRGHPVLAGLATAVLMTIQTFEEELLDSTEVAQFLRITLPTLQRWVRRGWIPAIKMPGGRGHLRFEPAGTQAFIRRNISGNSPQYRHGFRGG
jgi:excisionase family DNA binding protein